jgi:hypothetical protein
MNRSLDTWDLQPAPSTIGEAETGRRHHACTVSIRERLGREYPKRPKTVPSPGEPLGGRWIEERNAVQMCDVFCERFSTHGPVR